MTDLVQCTISKLKCTAYLKAVQAGVVITFLRRLRGSSVPFSSQSHTSWLSTHLDPPKNELKKMTKRICEQKICLNVCLYLI